MAKPPVDMPPESIVFGNFDGMVNTITRERMGITQLVHATNVDIDDAKQAHRRRGFTKRVDGDFHSLYRATGKVLVVRNDELSVLFPNYTTLSLSYVGKHRLAYCEVNGVVYFSSEVASGKIGQDNTVLPWGVREGAGTWLSPVIQPTETLGQIAGKLLGQPPMATALCAFSGRIYMAVGKVIWATELYMYDYVDRTRNFIQMESEIVGMVSVSDGIYVGTEDGLYFLSGPLGKMQIVKVLGSAVVQGSMITVPADVVRPQQSQSKEAAMAMTSYGVHLLLDGGACYNTTDDRMHFPSAASAAALFRRQDGVNQYIVAADHGGTPTSTARIGDYIDAEIRRFQGA